MNIKSSKLAIIIFFSGKSPSKSKSKSRSRSRRYLKHENNKDSNNPSKYSKYKSDYKHENLNTKEDKFPNSKNYKSPIRTNDPLKAPNKNVRDLSSEPKKTNNASEGLNYDFLYSEYKKLVEEENKTKTNVKQNLPKLRENTNFPRDSVNTVRDFTRELTRDNKNLNNNLEDKYSGMRSEKEDFKKKYAEEKNPGYYRKKSNDYDEYSNRNYRGSNNNFSRGKKFNNRWGDKNNNNNY